MNVFEVPTKTRMPLLLFLTLWLPSSRILFGQELSGQFQSRFFTEKEGLPSTLVSDINQDKDGVMWFATRSGIATYDGFTWEVHRNKKGLPGNMYVKLRIDNKGRMWTLGNMWPVSVSRYDGDQWTVFPLPELLTAKRILGSFLEIMPWSEDQTPLISILGEGMMIWERGRWRRLEFDGGPSTKITCVARYKESAFIIANGYAYVMDSAKEPRRLPWLADQGGSIISMAIEETPQGPVFWIYGGNWLGKYENGSFIHLRDLEPLQGEPIDYGPIIYPDRLGGVFFGGKFSLHHLTYDNKLTRFNIARGLTAEGATAIFKDHENAFWIAGTRGISRIPSLRFENFDTQGGLLENEVSAIAELAPNCFLFGHSKGLTLYRNGEFQPIPFPQDTPLLTRVVEIRKDGDGNAWMSLLGLGVGRMDKNFGLKFYDYEPKPANIYSVLPDKRGAVWALSSHGVHVLQDGVFKLASGAIKGIMGRRLFEDSEGTLYLTTIANGFWYLDGAWRNIKTSKPDENNVYAVLKDSKKRFWVGSYAGLFLREGETYKRAEPFGFKIDRPIYFMSEDPRGRIWFGTDNGVYRLDEDQWRYYSVAHGLSGYETNRGAGFTDSQGYFWVGTPQGASRYNERYDEAVSPPNLSQISLAVNEQPTPFHEPVTLSHSQNNLRFSFQAQSFIKEENVLYSSMMEGVDKDWSSSTNKQFIYRNISPGRYRFHYRAQNALGVWSKTVSSPLIQINKPYWKKVPFVLLMFIIAAGLCFSIIDYLSSKRYSRFLSAEVDAQTREISMKNILLEQKIQEQKQTEARVQALNEELEERVRERTTELEAAQKDLVENAHYTGMAEIATSILHNVGNILNSISTSGYVIRETVESSKMAAILKANQLLEQNMDRIEDFFIKDPKGLQLLNFYLSLGNIFKTENKKLNEHIKNLIEKIDTVKDVVAQQHNYASGIHQSEERSLEELLETSVKILETGMAGRDIEIQRHYEPVPKVKVQKTRLVHTLVNILKNASEAIQSHNGSERKIYLSIGREDSWIVVRIRDTGMGILKENLGKVFTHGFTTKEKGHGFGLHSCAEAMSHIGGALKVESEGEGRGATFVLQFPMLETGEPTQKS